MGAALDPLPNHLAADVLQISFQNFTLWDDGAPNPRHVPGHPRDLAAYQVIKRKTAVSYGCWFGWCWRYCNNNDWCYTTPPGHEANSHVYQRCEKDGQCPGHWNCAGECG